MTETVSKSKFKPNALEFFRKVQNTGQELIITDHGKPVLKIIPYCEDPNEALRPLRDTVISFTDPTEPVGDTDWEVLK
jgi:prevent-host-death family protein